MSASLLSASGAPAILANRDFINLLPNEILVIALGLTAPRSETDIRKRQIARNALQRSVACVCQRFSQLLPAPSEFVISHLATARIILDRAASGERTSVVRCLDVDLTHDRSVAFQEAMTEIILLLGSNLEHVRVYERGAAPHTELLDAALVNAFVQLVRVKSFAIKVSSQSGGIASNDVIRMLDRWKSLTSFTLSGFTVSDDPSSTSQATALTSLSSLRSLTFPAISASTGYFVRDLIHSSPALTRLDLSACRDVTQMPSLILPAHLIELHCRDVTLLLNPDDAKSHLRSLVKLRLNADCAEFSFLHNLPALRQLAIYVFDINALDDLDARFERLNNLQLFVIYGLVAVDLSHRHRISKTCKRLGIEFVTMRYWSAYEENKESSWSAN